MSTTKAIAVLLLFSTIALPLASSPSLSVSETDGRMGVCFIYHTDPQWPLLATNVGARSNRWQLSWYDAEPTSGNYDYAKYDVAVAADQAAGFESAVILMGTPDWAATAGSASVPRIHATVKRPPLSFQAYHLTSTSASPPTGLDRPWNDPANVWGRFVYTTVSRYKENVHIWEIWNEPDWDFFWTGTAEEYYLLLKTAYLAAKAADPSSTVVFGGLQLFSNPEWFQDVIRFILEDPDAPANNYFFDVLALHLYSRSNALYENVEWVRWRLEILDPGDGSLAQKPIWVNETGVPVWDDPPGPGYPYQWSATQDEAAAFIIQAYANALAADVERIWIFRLHDENMNEAFGLVRNDFSPRPAYTATQVAVSYLRDPLWVSRVPSGPNIRVSLWGSPLGKVSVLWNTTPETSTYTLPATMPTATLVTMAGTTETITATNGAYTFTLAPATDNNGLDENDYIIGGPPLIVIEADTRPPTANVHSLPEVVSTTFTVRWSGSDGESGIWSYDIQVQENGGPWQDWLTWTTATEATYHGRYRATYAFRARARDRAGNESAYPALPQATTRTVDPPFSCYLPLIVAQY